MKALKAGSLAILFLLSAIIPVINVEAANGTRTDTDRGYLSEKWHAGLGTGIGSLNSIKSADIDNDGEDELIFGNSKGYVHVLDWNASAGGWYEEFQTVDMGGPVKGMVIAQIDDDPQLEIAIGYNWNSDAGKVKIIDGSSLLAEANWSSGLSWSHTQWTEGWPYGLAMGDLDGDGEVELAMSGDRGFLWVVDTETPETYVGRDMTPDEAEWYVDIGAKVGGNTLENTWGLTFGQFDDDEAMEVAVGSKQGWIAVFDGETEELQWKYDMDGSSGADSLVYSLLSADLDGNGIDELIVPQQTKLTIFIDGDKDVRLEDTSIKSGYGLANADLFGDSNEELVVTDSSGNIKIIGLVGSSLTTYQDWSGGYLMNAGAGVTISMNGHDNPWIVHGSDIGMVVAWEVTSQSTHELAWSSNAENNANQLVYSLEGGNNYGVAMANIDDDDNLEILVGSGSGRVYAFDGKTYEADWVSPVLDKIPMGIAVGDLNNNGNNEIVITTGIPGEPRGEGVDGEGGEGFLYIFEQSGNDIVQAFKSDNIDASRGVTISELDGSTYPEIGIATGYLKIISATGGTTDLHGAVKVWGYGGSTYSEEWTSGDLEQIVGGIDSGDPDGDGDNELVIGTGGDDRGGDYAPVEPGEVRVYHRSGGSYSLDGSIMQPNRFDVFGIAVGDVNDNGQEDIIVGTGKFEEDKPKLLIYDGITHSEEFSKTVDSTSVWGVATGDFDNDGEPELIYGTSGGELFIYDGIEPTSFEAKTSALSNKAGHYGGIVIGNTDNEGPMEMVVGSDSYLWLFSTEGQTNKPDLAIDGADISYLPETPDEDEDITINLSVSNFGGSDTSKWRVLIYDGDPDAGGKKITEFECDSTEPEQRTGCKTLSNDESASFEVTWYGQQTSPGYHEIYGLAEDTNSPRQETRFSNNKDFTTIEIEEIPNDKPISVASIDNAVLWIDEYTRIDAGASYDTETTGGNPDQDADGDDNGNFADLQYRFYFDGGWTSWLNKFTQDVSFSTPGEKEVIIMSRDERRKESDEITINIIVKSNTQPIAILNSNISEVAEGGFVTFDVSQSYDPDYRVGLEYRFIFGDGIYSNWVVEGDLVVLYRDAFFNGPNGGDLELGGNEELLRDSFGIGRVFKLTNGSELPVSFGLGEGLFLLEMIDSSVTSNGYNYTLPSGTEEKTYGTQILVREFSEDTGDLLVSALSSPVSIRVYKPENINPVATAKAGIFYGSVSGSFTDQLTGARTGDEITYSAAESYDPDGDDGDLTYEWRIVDSRGLSLNLLGDKNAQTFKRTYNEPGTYTAILTVTDKRGGSATWQVDAVVTKSDGYGNDVEEEGYSQMKLLGAAAIGIIGLVGGAMGLNRMRSGNEDEFEEMFEDIAPGSLELNCPNCNGLISITTTQRPIQVGCPMCQSQFVIRE
jgi:hypothetical protein|tara:strand:- start:856 stop:5091 length:4236 start_codon:yes stop_codon:yes gene_type:complete